MKFSSLAVLDIPADDDKRLEEAYSKWFLGGRATSSSDLKRVGYCLGYLVLDKIAAGRDFAEMADWSESRYAQLERDALLEIASP